MAQGLGALAQGFIQGSRLGMQFKNQERQAEKENELSKLRQSAEGRAVENQAMAVETHDKNIELADLKEGRAQSAEKRAVSGEKRAVNQEARLQAEQNWRIAKNARAEKDTKLASLAPIELQRVAAGGEFSPEFMEEAKGTRFDPQYMVTPEYREATKAVYNHVGDLVKKAKEQGADSIGLEDVNKTDFLNGLDVMMAPDVKWGIGEKDPTTGKTVVDKNVKTIIPYEGQGLVVDVEVMLDDGSSYIAPITEGRTHEPDDPVKIIPIDKFIDNVQGNALMASAYNKPDLQNAVARYASAPNKPNQSAEVTKRQYLKEQSGILREQNKAIADINNNVVFSGAKNAKKKAEAIKAVRDESKKSMDAVSQMYGYKSAPIVGKGSSSVVKPVGGGQKMIDVDTWSGDDPNKKAFIKSAEEYSSTSGESPFDAFTPDELDGVFREWQNQKEADELADLLAG